MTSLSLPIEKSNLRRKNKRSFPSELNESSVSNETELNTSEQTIKKEVNGSDGKEVSDTTNQIENNDVGKIVIRILKLLYESEKGNHKHWKQT